MSKFFNAMAVAVLGIAMLMGAASAADMTLQATNSATTEVTVSPDSISEWALTTGTANTYFASTLTLSTNNPDGAEVYAKEPVNGNNVADGKMYSPDVNDNLDQALVLMGDSVADITLSGSDQLLYYRSSTGVSADVPFNYVQTVDWADPVADDYEITVTFTAQTI
jgi:hypothetical protein